MPRSVPQLVSQAVGAAALAVLLVLAAWADDTPQARLQDLRQRIERVQDRIEADTDERDKALAALRDAERRSASASGELRATREALSESRERQRHLRAAVAEGRERLAAGREALADHVRSAYAIGNTERLRLILNQQDPARLGRILVYYRYLSKAKADRIAGVLEDLDRLRVAEGELDANTARLEALAARQAGETRRLEAARQERAAAVARLDAGIRDRRAQAVRLEAEAKTLQELIAELQRALEDIPGTDRPPLRSLKGRLSWPIAGRLINDFGQPRADGSLRWNGVLVGASPGRDVLAIYYGRVAYADWLPGMGLLIVIEHGDGYMSLYGHNEILYREVGDWVEPGDVIAGAGDSGGRDRVALYFEIRRGGKPENPHRWFSGRLPAG